jgi:acyl dehydratase
MTTRELTTAPCTPRLFARAALPLVPGASLLPFVPGHGKRIPDLELTLAAVEIDARHLADYDHVCGFTLRDTLPATYLHIRAFPLHLALMTDSHFPFPAIGLVHLKNRITVHRPASINEQFDLHVTATAIEPHPKGRTFTIVTTATVEGETVWEGHSTMLKRGGGTDADRAGGAGAGVSAASPANATEPAETPPPATGPARSSARAQAQWRLSGDLGRRYAAVSKDRNPIHLHQATARLFGFPRPIAHGMWTKAACLAALEPQLPDAYTVDVQFRKPIFLPGKATFEARDGAFAVKGANDILHLEGTVTT